MRRHLRVRGFKPETPVYEFRVPAGMIGGRGFAAGRGKGLPTSAVGQDSPSARPEAKSLSPSVKLDKAEHYKMWLIGRPGRGGVLSSSFSTFAKEVAWLVIHPTRHSLCPLGIIIEAGDQFQLFTPVLLEVFHRFHANLFQRLQAVHRECRADNQQAFHAFAGQLPHCLIRCRFQPLGSPQAGLECQRPLVVGEASLFRERLGGGKHLMTVTGLVSLGRAVAAAGG